MKKWLLGMVLMCLTQTLSAQDILREDSLQEVVVTGTGTQHLLKDAPVQTEVINKQMLQNYSGQSLEDILVGLTSSFSFNEGDMGSQMQMIILTSSSSLMANASTATMAVRTTFHLSTRTTSKRLRL